MQNNPKIILCEQSTFNFKEYKKIDKLCEVRYKSNFIYLLFTFWHKIFLFNLIFFVYFLFQSQIPLKPIKQ